MKSAKQPRNHPRNVALLFIATGALFGLYGTGIGSIMLAALSGFRIPFAYSSFFAHPYLQVYGFIFMFVIGVAYVLVPRFKAEKVKSIALAYISYILVTSADLGFVFSDRFSLHMLGSISSLLFLIGVLLFSLQTLPLAFEERGGFPETNPLIAESALAALLSSIALFLSNTQWLGIDTFSDSSIFLTLLGFSSSMIYAVEIRSVSFRQSDYRPFWANITWIFQGIAIFVSFASILTFSYLLLIVSEAFYLLAAISCSISLKLFEMSHPLMYRPSMTRVHYRIMNYNNIAMIPAFIWLFIAIISAMIISLGVLQALPHSLQTFAASFYIRDLFIHSIAIGFIGSTILCYAPMLLPGLLGRRGPTTGLSYYPVIILNFAVLLRVVGDIFSIRLGYLPEWEAISGPLVIISMLWFLWMVHRVGKGKTVEREEGQFMSEKRLKGIAEIRIYSQEKTDVKPPAYWFCYSKGLFYVIPSQHKNFDLLSNIKNYPSVEVELQGKLFKANYTTTSERSVLKKVEKLFKDKYSQRNFRDFFGEQVDTVLVLKLVNAEIPAQRSFFARLSLF